MDIIFIQNIEFIFCNKSKFFIDYQIYKVDDIFKSFINVLNLCILFLDLILYIGKYCKLFFIRKKEIFKRFIRVSFLRLFL